MPQPDRFIDYNFYNTVAGEYEKSLNRHGHTARGVMWSTEEVQRVRLQILSSVITEKNALLFNDLGCGFGAMFDHLASAGFLKSTSVYFGYDISRSMLKALAEKKDPRIKPVLNCELKTKADYSFASGTFNLKLDKTNDEWTDTIKRHIVNFDQYSAFGFAFNLLSVRSKRQFPGLFYADGEEVKKWVAANIAGNVVLKDDYLDEDFTIIVNK